MFYGAIGLWDPQQLIKKWQQKRVLSSGQGCNI